MSWFTTSKDKKPASASSTSEPVSHHSLGFRALTRSLRQEGGSSILDLGPALGQNIAFFGRYGCRVHVGDLHRSRLEVGVFDKENEHPERYFAKLLPLSEGESFDVIVAWDLLDYLVAPEVTGLIAHLRPTLHEGTLLFSTVSYQKEIPANPTRFRIADDEHLIYEPTGSGRRPCPRHKQPDLERSMPGFRIDSSYLLRNGMQEYLWAYKGSGN